MNTQIIGYPFVSHVDQEKRPIIENAKEFIEKSYSFGYTNNINLIKYGKYKTMGYEFNFKSYLKKYLYKQYGQWNECYAPNKTKLRKVIYGKVDKIIEIN